MLTPMSAAVSRSWKVARIARPSRVRARRRCAPTIRSQRRSRTRRRGAARRDTGPSARGAVGNGVGTLLATPPHAEQLAVLQRDPEPDHHQHGGVDRLRRAAARSSSRSQSAPASAPTTMASGDGDEEVQPHSADERGEGQRRRPACRTRRGRSSPRSSARRSSVRPIPSSAVGAAQHQPVQQVLEELVQAATRSPDTAGHFLARKSGQRDLAVLDLDDEDAAACSGRSPCPPGPSFSNLIGPFTPMTLTFQSAAASPWARPCPRS